MIVSDLLTEFDCNSAYDFGLIQHCRDFEVPITLEAGDYTARIMYLSSIIEIDFTDTLTIDTSLLPINQEFIFFIEDSDNDIVPISITENSGTICNPGDAEINCYTFFKLKTVFTNEIN